MTNKEIIIIVLLIVVIYLYYQQSKRNISLLAISIQDKERMRDLQQEVQHYQTLYQKRVEKDLGLENQSVEVQTEKMTDDKETQTEKVELVKEHQEQLKKINLLFDANAVNYKVIDFNGLYALLQTIAEREREREQNSGK